LSSANEGGASIRDKAAAEAMLIEAILWMGVDGWDPVDDDAWQITRLCEEVKTAAFREVSIARSVLSVCASASAPLRPVLICVGGIDIALLPSLPFSCLSAEQFAAGEILVRAAA
jgi:hypothetical protein